MPSLSWWLLLMLLHRAQWDLRKCDLEFCTFHFYFKYYVLCTNRFWPQNQNLTEQHKLKLFNGEVNDTDWNLKYIDTRFFDTRFFVLYQYISNFKQYHWLHHNFSLCCSVKFWLCILYPYILITTLGFCLKPLNLQTLIKFYRNLFTTIKCP
jgi:hypothetical protein